MKLESGRYFKTGIHGLQDITACHEGRFIAIEVKTQKGRQSKDQKALEKKVIESGGEYLLARSLGDVKEFFAL